MIRIYTLCLLLLLTFAQPLPGQSWRPIPSSGSLWKLEHSVYDLGFPGCVGTMIYHHYTDGDTVIDSLPVTRVRTGSTFMCQFDALCIPYPDHGAVDYIFQDTVAGTVWRKIPGAPLMLLFDFSAMPGDTVNNLDYFGPVMESVVDSVDTVTFADGKPRKRLYISNWMFFSTGGKSVWVEGIGDIYKGLMPTGEYDDDCHALCYQEAGMDLSECYSPWSPYSWCTAPACDLLVEQEEEIMLKALKIVPNPSGQLSFSGPLPTGTETEIISVDGKICPISNPDELPAGVYGVRLLRQGIPVFTGKWLKQE